MEQFTGAEYLMIDVANAFGLDKEIYSKRINWVKANFDSLESFTEDADEPVLYLKAVQTIRNVQRGEETGHLVELDATTSGLQFMSALTGCPTGALWTNLVDPTKRYDAYTESYSALTDSLSKSARTSKEVTRARAKDALMTSFYGSSAQPEKVFGKGSNELEAFYSMCERRLKGCWELRNDLIELWNPYAEDHTWTLPDGYTAYVPTKVKKEAQCEIDELDHHTFTYKYESFEGTEQGVALAANVIHSVDGYVVREVGRRVNYKPSEISRTLKYIDAALTHRDTDIELDLSMPMSVAWATKLGAAKQFNTMDTSSLLRLKTILLEMQTKEPAELVCIHDAFKAHANHCNTVRYWYKEILAELAESDLLSHIFSEISGQEEKYENVRGGYTKTEMAALIRKSNYAIC